VTDPPVPSNPALPAAGPAIIDSPVLSERLHFDPLADVESWRLTIPAKPACFVLEDEHGRPVLLSTVADLRHALLRRLAPGADEQPARIDYRAIVRHVRFRPVFGRFEANWAYAVNARHLFAREADKLLRRFHAHWVGIDLSDRFPRWITRDEPVSPSATCFGPLPDSRTARRCIEVLEDVFDLCREHALLVQAPHAVACAYKQMGRCPAPCDGSIPMEDYLHRLRESIAMLSGGRAAWTQQATQRMKQAAAALKFEEAARIKAQLDAAALFDSPAAAMLRPLSDFDYLSFQPGPRKNLIRPFRIQPGIITQWPDLPVKHLVGHLSALITALADRPPVQTSGGVVHHDLLALASWHLLGGPREQGLFIHRSDWSEAVIGPRIDDWLKRAPAAAAEDVGPAELASDVS
jgi:hypothetical protein